MIEITKATRNTKNRIFAIEAAPVAIPVKPKTAAIIAMIKNVTVQLSMLILLLLEGRFHELRLVFAN